MNVFEFSAQKENFLSTNGSRRQYICSQS